MGNNETIQTLKELWKLREFRKAVILEALTSVINLIGMIIIASVLIPMTTKVLITFGGQDLLSMLVILLCMVMYAIIFILIIIFILQTIQMAKRLYKEFKYRYDIERLIKIQSEYDDIEEES